MNIRTYYEKTARMCFHVSWIALIIAVVFFVLHASDVFEGNIIVITAPFLIVSIVQSIGARIYENRMKDLPQEYASPASSPLETKDILLTFMPAPTLRVLLFHPDGSLLGEIKDRNMSWFMWMVPNSLSMILKKRYILTDANGEVLAEYAVQGGIGTAFSMRDGSGNLIGSYKESLRESLFRLKGMIYSADGQEWIPVNVGGMLTEFQLKTIAGKPVAAFQKGWMPLDWGKRFKDMNTPILTFHEKATAQQKIAVFGFCASALNHRSN
ncbi:hypothetical protein [Peribacillus glennii]|uniref:Uncharacterized protein n=1 Tax=Peribacillus glennii TaxID=2303991 RepID=A0A372LHE0_9BACI|nr:hypothetical protein [Peribacillus glennii]RFU65404.1 hypothetical protein D0466_05800 [Peribacillus glennii]